MQNDRKENKMGVMPVGKLLVNMSLPIMVSMLVQALYNIVDSIYVAQINENALTAVSLAFPIQNIMIAIATGTGVGINALLSKSLGEKNYEEANRAATNGVFLALLSSLAFLVLGFLLPGVFFRMQTGDAEIVQYGIEYLRICMTISFGLFGAITFERLLQSTGKTLLSMFAQMAGAITNIVLDPILIFGWFGLPAMGVAGAALATVIGQVLGMVVAMLFNHYKNDEIHVTFKGFKPHGATIKRVYQVGVPSIIMQTIGSIMTFGLNRILIGFTSTATAVLGVYFKLQSFIHMPVFGLNNGLVPIVSYNYGARRPDRMKQAIKYAILYAMGIMLIGLAVFQIFPEQLLKMFKASEDMIRIGVPALRLISLSWIFAGYCIICGTVFQALGHGFLSLINSLVRQMIVLLPVAYLLSLTRNLDLVWLAFPIAEIASVVLSTIFLRRILREVINPIEQELAQEAAQATP